MNASILASPFVTRRQNYCHPIGEPLFFELNDSELREQVSDSFNECERLNYAACQNLTMPFAKPSIKPMQRQFRTWKILIRPPLLRQSMLKHYEPGLRNRSRATALLPNK